MLKPQINIQDEEEEENISSTVYQKLSVFLCGTNEEVQTNTHFDMTRTKEFLRENKTVSSVLNSLAVTLMVIVGFMIGFYK